MALIVLIQHLKTMKPVRLTALLLAGLCPNLFAQADAALFDDKVLQDVRLTMDPAAWATLRANYTQDDYYNADFAWGTTSLANIGIKSRGSGSRSPEKPNLTVKFNKNVKQKFLGHNTIQLKANNQDGSMLREYLTMSLARRLGLPAVREAPARPFINGEFWGLYTIVENPDDDYLVRAVGEANGFLYDFNPILDYHFNYLGEDPARYGDMYTPKSHEDAPEFGKLFEMLRLVNESTAETFPQVGAEYLNLPELMKLLAVESYVSDEDGVLSDVFGMNNFYLFRGVNSKQFRFLPWDTDDTMYWSGRPVLQNLEGNELTRRAMEVPALRQVYVETMLQTAAVSGGKGGWLRKEMDRLYAMIGAAARLDPHKQCWRAGIMVACDASDFEREVAVIKQFAEDRFTTTVPQLEALVGAGVPQMSSGGAVNAATQKAGLVPGSLGTLYGSSMARTGEVAAVWPLPQSLAGVEVDIDGVAAPLLFVSPQQVNFQVPWNLAEGPASVQLSVEGMTAPGVTAELVHAAPGVFTVAHGVDFAPVDAANRATAGEVVSVFGTGFGAITPEARDGEAAPAGTLFLTREAVTATLNGASATVLFSGLAPGYAGLYQINLRLPASVTAGDGSLVLKVAGRESPAFRLPLK